MDQRTPLSQGALVRQYIIDKRIGEGASCLVYEAHYLDSGNHRKESILKECYPYKAGITRVGNKIIWSDPAEQDNALSRFDTAYEVAAKIQNTAGAKSVSVYSLDKFEENGTKYVATIPNGNSYDKNESEDIADILRTALALTNAVDLYHKAGYLHLDIKPSNFIATEDQTGKGKNIVLFDVDTVVSLEDVQNGNLRSISYSKEFAAPEQKMQQTKKLCPATDLYAVGAVLFERIMKRPVECFDSGLFATWDYDSRFDAKRINPKVKRLLTEVFHKTLAANVKRRYQSAGELAVALEELVKIVDGDRPYIYSPHYVSTCNFVGRNEELAELHRALSDGKPVFVNGAGGIGKTELVKKYVSLHQDEYDAVVFIHYNGSVSDCLNEIEILGIDIEDKDNKTLLKEICDENVLIILDNYDVAPNESKGLDELFDLNCKIIVTSRTDFSERNPNAHFIEVSGLSPIALREIFENESGLTLSDSEFEDMQMILHVGQECTYFWSMIARLAKEGAYTIPEIVEKVNTGLDDLEDSEDVFDTKDGKNINTTVAEAMLVLFNLDKLNDKDFEVLKAMYFLDCMNMDIRQIKEMLSFSENKLMNFFNASVKKGYIQKITIASREVYHITDVLKNVLEYREELDISKSELVTAFIEKKLCIDKKMIKKANNQNLPVKDRVNHVIICLFKIFYNLNWNTLGNGTYCINKMYDCFAGELHYFRYTFNSSVGLVMDKIIKFIDRNDIPPITKIQGFTVLIAWSCYYIDTDTAENIFWLGITEIESNHIKNQKIIDYFCKPIVCICDGDFSINHLFSSDLINKIIEINPLCFQNETLLNSTLSENSKTSFDNEGDIYSDESATINCCPSLTDKNGNYSIDLFLSSIDEYDSQEYVYYFIAEFADMVRYHFDAQNNEANKYIVVGDKLEKALNKHGIAGKYVEIHDGDWVLIDYDEAEAKLLFSLAIMYSKLFIYDAAYKYLILLFECLKRYLKKLSIDELNTVKSTRIRDYLILSNRTLSGQLVVPLLNDFIKTIRDTYNITDEADERLYGYYKPLVNAAERAKMEIENGIYHLNYPLNSFSLKKDKGSADSPSLFITKQDYDEIIEKYSKLIRQISGQEYYP